MSDYLKKESVRQFLTFCIMGSIGVSFNYSIFFILFHFLHVYYIISSATGFIIGIFLVFFLNKQFTFRVPSYKDPRILFVKYFIVNITSLLIGLLMLRFFVEILYINIYIANLFVLGITSVTNFTGSKLFAFRV